jgi:hypothetical protein
MPALSPAAKYLRTKCGLPPVGPTVVDDLDDPAARLLTPSEAAAAAHVPESTLRSWVHRRQLTPTPEGLYRESDVLRAERATRRPARTRRLITEAASQFHDLTT